MLQVSHKLTIPKFVIVLLLISSLVLIYFYFKPKENNLKDGQLSISGRIEGYETNVGAKIGGRVEHVKVREGDLVKKGELIAQLSDEDIQAQLRGANALIEKAKEQVKAKQYRLDVLKAQIAQANLKVSQSQEDSLGKVRQWEANVAMTESRLSETKAQLIQAEADLELAKLRKERYDFLLAKEAVTKDESDQITNTFLTAKALVEAKQSSVKASEHELKATKGQLVQASSSRLSPCIQNAERESCKMQFTEAEHQLKQAEQEVSNAIANRDQIEANISYLKILSPIDGVVTARAVEPGAVLVPGQIILSVINFSSVFLRAYVPEKEIAKVKIGQAAEIFLDSYPDKAFLGKVSQIDTEGSFTPENIYFKDDRVRQVFGIKIALDKPDGCAKPGMPADACLKVN